MSEGPEADNPGVVMMPPLIFLIAIVASIALDFIVPIAFLPAPGPGSWSSWVGALLIIAGVALSASGVREFRRNGTNLAPNRPALKVVTSGPYRFTRNPMYLGMIVALAGLVLAFSLEVGIVVWVIFALVLHFGVVLREERYMTRKFGAPYEALLRSTRRWV